MHYDKQETHEACTVIVQSGWKHIIFAGTKLMAEITVKGGKRTLHYESQMSLGWLYPFEQQRTAIEGLNRLKAVGKEVKSRHALCMVPFACGAMLIDAAGTAVGRCKNVMNW